MVPSFSRQWRLLEAVIRNPSLYRSEGAAAQDCQDRPPGLDQPINRRRLEEHKPYSQHVSTSFRQDTPAYTWAQGQNSHLDDRQRLQARSNPEQPSSRWAVWSTETRAKFVRPAECCASTSRWRAFRWFWCPSVYHIYLRGAAICR